MMKGGVSIIGRKTRDLRRKRFTFLGGKQGQSWHQDPTEWDKSEHPLRTGHLESLSVPSPLNPFPFLMLMLKKTKPLLSWVELSCTLNNTAHNVSAAATGSTHLWTALHCLSFCFGPFPTLMGPSPGFGLLFIMGLWFTVSLGSVKQRCSKRWDVSCPKKRWDV